ncbi:potassium transporter 5-like [Apium graveolens]|uniref:potassium transporter 5-like n=1 Tax=Apium graveolens TaxID=4045 RepID=UPI003D79D591
MEGAKLRRVMHSTWKLGSTTHTHHSQASWGRTLILAFQCLGVIYGDVGTSPLYVYSSTFTDGIKDNQDILGVLSLIIYTLLLSPLIKYAFIVLRANDTGNGGTFALYSLISRHANMSLVPNAVVGISIANPSDFGFGFNNLGVIKGGIHICSNHHRLVCIHRLFKRNGSKGWQSLGGVVLCITGTEAMFADIGHFSVLAVQLSFSTVVLPALLSTYIGQAAYLSKNPGDVLDTFYASIPG